jgi:hypothetical protein
MEMLRSKKESLFWLFVPKPEDTSNSHKLLELMFITGTSIAPKTDFVGTYLVLTLVTEEVAVKKEFANVTPGTKEPIVTNLVLQGVLIAQVLAVTPVLMGSTKTAALADLVTLAAVLVLPLA